MPTNHYGLAHPALTAYPNIPSDIQSLADTAGPLVVAHYDSAGVRAIAYDTSTPADGELSYNRETGAVEQYSVDYGGWLPGNWITPGLGNGWSALGGAYGPPRYTVRGGMLVLDGSMTGGSSAATVFTLPAGLRPLFQQTYLTESNGNGVARIVVTNSGMVSVGTYIAGGSNSSVALNGVQWVIEQ